LGFAVIPISVWTIKELAGLVKNFPYTIYVGILRTQFMAIGFLDKKQQFRLFRSFLLLVMISILDVIGIGALALIFSQISPQNSPKIMSRILELVRSVEVIGSMSDRKFMFLTLCVSVMFFGFKSVLSIGLISRVFKYLAEFQTSITEVLISRILKANYDWERKQDPHLLSNTLLTGVSATFVNSLGNFLVFSVEAFIVFLYGGLIFLIDFKLGFGALLFTATVLYLMNKILSRNISRFSQELNQTRLANENSIFNILKLFREIRISGHEVFYEKEISSQLKTHGNLLARDATIQQVPKYFIEFTMSVGIFLVLMYGQFVENSATALGVLSLFILIITRAFPSLLRIQSSLLSMRSFKHYAFSIQELLLHLEDNQALKTSDNPEQIVNYSGISINAITYGYPDDNSDLISDFSLKIPWGSRIAIVGSSGSGKSTLVDLLLGLLEPKYGSVGIDSIQVRNWQHENPKSLAYLPQETYLVTGTVLENICLGVTPGDIDKSRLEIALSKSGLLTSIEERKIHLGQEINPLSTNLSGGERQKIGLTRVFYENPAILILDEATSSLDAESEAHLLDSLLKEDDPGIVIFIAHRLSSVRDFERILFMDSGSLIGDGTFNFLQQSIPKFAKFTSHMGL
jgi:ABC-type multidrug transport system fused ATPase/permease subunit